MRNADTVLSIIRSRTEYVAGEPDETETLTSGSEGGCWKSTPSEQLAGFLPYKSVYIRSARTEHGMA